MLKNLKGMSFKILLNGLFKEFSGYSVPAPLGERKCHMADQFCPFAVHFMGQQFQLPEPEISGKLANQGIPCP